MSHLPVPRRPYTGVYLPFSGVVLIDRALGSFDYAHDSLVASAEEEPNGMPHLFAITKQLRPPRGQEELSFWLTRTHELAHYTAFYSSPVGIFLMRLLKALASCIYEAAHGFSMFARKELPRKRPIDTWYRREGQYLVSGRPPPGESPERSVRNELARKFDLARGYFVLYHHFLEGGLSAGELCTLLTAAGSTLRKLHYIWYDEEIGQAPPPAPIITTTLPQGKFPEDYHGITVLSIFEAISVLAECVFLQSFAGSPELTKAWEHDYLKSPDTPEQYTVATRLLLKEFSYDIQKALLALDWALLGPIDLMCSEKELLFEEVHPVCRLERIVPILKKLTLSSMPRDKIYATLDAHAGAKISTRRALQVAGTRKLLDERAHTTFFPEWTGKPEDLYYWAPVELVGELLTLQAWANCFWRDVEDQFRRGLLMRTTRAGILDLISPHGIRFYRPVMEIYRDRIITHLPMSRRPILAHTYQATMSGLAALWLMDAADFAEELQWVAEAFRREIPPEGDPASFFFPLDRDQYLQLQFRLAVK